MIDKETLIQALVDLNFDVKVANGNCESIHSTHDYIMEQIDLLKIQLEEQKVRIYKDRKNMKELEKDLNDLTHIVKDEATKTYDLQHIIGKFKEAFEDPIDHDFCENCNDYQLSIDRKYSKMD